MGGQLSGKNENTSDNGGTDNGGTREPRKPWVKPRVSEIPIEETGSSPHAGS